MGSGKGTTKRVNTIIDNKQLEINSMIENIEKQCEISDKKLMLISIMGSHAYNLAHKDSDVDYRGIYLLPIRDRLGIEMPNNTLSIEGDDDTVMYEFGHFCKLAYKGNPNVLEILFQEPNKITPLGEHLLKNKDLFITQAVRPAYYGFVFSCLKNIREQSKKDGMEKKIKKSIRHALRVGWQGQELLTTGKITVALTDEQKETIKNVENLNYEEAQELLNKELVKLTSLPSNLPEKNNIKTINEFIYQTYLLVDKNVSK